MASRYYLRAQKVAKLNSQPLPLGCSSLNCLEIFDAVVSPKKLFDRR
jgi:hypothetical protein